MLVPLVVAASLIFLQVLGAVGAGVLRATGRVAFWAHSRWGRPQPSGGLFGASP